LIRVIHLLVNRIWVAELPLQLTSFTSLHSPLTR